MSLMSRLTLARVAIALTATAMVAACGVDDTSVEMPDPTVLDPDGDALIGADDNCPGEANADQADFDGDGIGDVCDDDADADDVLANLDCDDFDPNVLGGTDWFGDLDGDGLGDLASRVTACEAPANFVANSDDTEPNCATNDTDVCGVCGGAGETLWYADTDGDRLGDPAVSELACDKPDGFVANADDLEPACATNDSDVCGVCAGPGEVSWFEDLDADGLGNPAVSEVGCVAPEGFVANGDDLEPSCATNDTDACGVCGGPGAITYYADADADGLGDPASPSIGCNGIPIGYVDNSDDLQPACTTNDEDVCGVCAGPGEFTYWADGDADGLGDALASIEACSAPAGFVDNADDLEPACTTNDTDECGVCAGGNADMDCVGVCFGAAYIDGCNRCVGGTSPIAPSDIDDDFDGIPDVCDMCNGGEARTIIQFEGVTPFDGGGGPFTFQVVLYENGDFNIVYADMEPFEDVSATVGWQSPGGEEFALLGFNSEYARETGHAYVRADEATGIPELEYTVPYIWYDIQHIGTELDLADEESAQVNLPHGFDFYGQTYGVVYVNSNGILTFEDENPGYQNRAFPVEGLGAVIAPFWDDLNPARGGSVYFYTAPSGCDVDCDGMAGGVAIVDSCGLCIGGTTGIGSDDIIDCNGECFGEAFIDACGVCAGGTTGVDPSGIDECEVAPDLVIDDPYLRERLYIDYIDADENPCFVNENCLGGPGMRKVVRFGTRIGNIGNADLTLGVPPANGTNEGRWVWDDCHGHHHYEAYAEYRVESVATGEFVDDGAKNGFCVMDLGTYRPDLVQTSCNVYNCGNQGIGAGCQDTYWSGLVCQWVDVTDLPDGDYVLHVTTNPLGEIPELNYDNNTGTVTMRLTGDSVSVLD